ncbi:uncharacterized protein LOC131020607 [Salvia miltiorrhiza]|uniref:uncharacterized protein LOC131020607 n=1 Tax=Salvia miltiorrhiza TaxID=226208 RepID=UPI0025AD3377|nr:uncharacterized protein LOC131020607 [Salvia miltiorrhiza]
MEENEENRVVANGVIQGYWFWAGASAVQFRWGVAALKRGYAGNGNLMPLKAFAVATLFVGASASAAVATLQLSGIRSVEDLKSVGASIKSACKSPR